VPAAVGSGRVAVNGFAPSVCWQVG